MTIKKAAPNATEAISYKMPTFKLKGNLVYFAAFSKHISFFPTSSGIAEFKMKLEGYETSKGTIRFPIGKPIPYDLIFKITKFRVKEVIENEMRKKLEIAAYKIADEYRSGKWPHLQDDHSEAKWKKSWSFLVRELKKRSSGFTKKDYDRALENGFRESMF